MFFIAAGFFCLFMTPRESFAACTMSITQTAALDFTGGGTGTLDMSNNNSSVDAANATSGAARIYGAAPVHGAFTLKDSGGCGNTTICITVSDTGGVAGLALSWPNGNNLLKYNGAVITNGQCGLVNPAAGGTPLLVGAKATYSGMTIGAKSPTFNVLMTENANTKNLGSTASIKFDTGLSFTAVTGINFGYAKAATVGDYVMSTTGTVTASGGGVIEPVGTTAVGSVTILGSASQAITISVGNYVQNNGVLPSLATGKYGAGADDVSFPMSVAAPGAGGTVLKLGVKVHADGTQADSATPATPTFDVTVGYQ